MQTQTTHLPEAPAAGVRLAAQAEGEQASMVHRLKQMSLEELLYYVLVGDGRQLGAEPR
jgi:hypothetical protein